MEPLFQPLIPLIKSFSWILFVSTNRQCMDKVYKIMCNIKLFTTKSNHTKGIMGTLSKSIVTPSRSIMDNIIKMTEKSINSTFRFLCKCQGLALFWEKISRKLQAINYWYNLCKKDNLEFQSIHIQRKGFNSKSKYEWVNKHNNIEF